MPPIRYGSKIVGGKKIHFPITDTQVGGAYREMKPAKTEEEKQKIDKMKNFSIKPTPETTKNKISQDKLNKFINLKL